MKKKTVSLFQVLIVNLGALIGYLIGIMLFNSKFTVWYPFVLVSTKTAFDAFFFYRVNKSFEPITKDDSILVMMKATGATIAIFLVVLMIINLTL